jgi:ATP synthase proteolipid subunit
MAGIIGIYGLVVSVLVANDLTQQLPLYTGFIQLGAGLAVGLAGLAAGYVRNSIDPNDSSSLVMTNDRPAQFCYWHCR